MNVNQISMERERKNRPKFDLSFGELITIYLQQYTATESPRRDAV